MAGEGYKIANRNINKC